MITWEGVLTPCEREDGEGSASRVEGGVGGRDVEVDERGRDRYDASASLSLSPSPSPSPSPSLSSSTPRVLTSASFSTPLLNDADYVQPILMVGSATSNTHDNNNTTTTTTITTKNNTSTTTARAQVLHAVRAGVGAKLHVYGNDLWTEVTTVSGSDTKLVLS